MDKNINNEDMTNYRSLVEKRKAYQLKIDQLENYLNQQNRIKLISKVIKYQRWYFFKNYDGFLFDKDSGLLWANINSFDIEMVSKDKINSTLKNFKIDNIENWKLPNEKEKADCFKPGFPFYETINSFENRSIDLMGDFDKILFFPCNSKLQNSYQKKIDKNDNTEILILEFFIENGWVPDLNSDILEDIFYNYRIKYNTSIELKKLEKEINSIFNDNKKIEADSVFLELNSIIKHFNLKDIDHSPLRYHKSILKLLSIIDIEINKVIQNNKDILKKADEINKFSYRVHTSSAIIDNRTLFLKSITDFTFKDLKYKINQFRKKSESILNQLQLSLTFEELYNIENYKKPNFIFFIEHIVDSFNLNIERFNWFFKNYKEIKTLLTIHNHFAGHYKDFRTNDRDDFIKKFQNKIGSNSNIWLTTWQKELIFIEEILSIIFEKVFNYDIDFDNFSTITSKIEEYRTKLNSIFKENFLNLYNKQEIDEEIKEIKNILLETLDNYSIHIEK